VGHPAWLQAPVTASIEDSLIVRRFPWFERARFMGAQYAPGFDDVWIGRPQRLDQLHAPWRMPAPLVRRDESQLTPYEYQPTHPSRRRHRISGTLLAHYLSERGCEVVVLTRRPDPRSGAVRQVHWDGRIFGDWAGWLNGAQAVINLAGRSVNCRYHARNRREILESRVQSTKILGEAIAKCAQPPRVWLNSSTATIYKHSFDRRWTSSQENSAPHRKRRTFSQWRSARAWERALEEAPTPQTRKVALRTAMVLGPWPNSVFPVLRRLVRFGLGGRMASGNQYVSWIHEEDFAAPSNGSSRAAIGVGRPI